MTKILCLLPRCQMFRLCGNAPGGHGVSWTLRRMFVPNKSRKEAPRGTAVRAAVSKASSARDGANWTSATLRMSLFQVRGPVRGPMVPSTGSLKVRGPMAPSSRYEIGASLICRKSRAMLAQCERKIGANSTSWTRSPCHNPLQSESRTPAFQRPLCLSCPTCPPSKD